jgi:hypothetical protein
LLARVAHLERGDKNDLKVSELEHLQQVIIAMPDEEKRKAIHASLVAGGFPANKIMETNG